MTHLHRVDESSLRAAQLMQSDGGESIDTLFRSHEGDDFASMENHAARCFWRTRDWPLIAVRCAVAATVLLCLLAVIFQ